MWFSGSNSTQYPAFVATYVLQAITLSPWMLIMGVNGTATMHVTEKNYSSQWTAVATDPAVVSVTPNSQNGTFTATGVSPGATTITVYDTMYNWAQVKVTVQ